MKLRPPPPFPLAIPPDFFRLPIRFFSFYSLKMPVCEEETEDVPSAPPAESEARSWIPWCTCRSENHVTPRPVPLQAAEGRWRADGSFRFPINLIAPRRREIT